MASVNTSKLEKEGLPSYCEVCGYSFFVTRHRIRRKKNGGKYVPGNVIVLCPNHHVEAESGKISKLEQFTIVHKRIRSSRVNLNGHS